MSDKSTASGGTGLATLLTVLFVALKLTGVIDWSWWWVVSPMIIAFSVFILLVAVFLFIGK